MFRGVQRAVETHPTKLSTCAGRRVWSTLRNYLFFPECWCPISWWRPAKPRTGTHFHCWLVLKQYVLLLTGIRPRKLQGIDFVTIMKFQFRVSNYSQQCACVWVRLFFSSNSQQNWRCCSWFDRSSMTLTLQWRSSQDVSFWLSKGIGRSTAEERKATLGTWRATAKSPN